MFLSLGLKFIPGNYQFILNRLNYILFGEKLGLMRPNFSTKSLSQLIDFGAEVIRIIDYPADISLQV